MSTTTNPRRVGSHLREILAESGVDVTLLVRPVTSVAPHTTESVERGDNTNPETLSVAGHVFPGCSDPPVRFGGQ